MKKLLFVGVLAVTTYPALACDWNHEASAKDQVVATTAVTTEQTSQATQTAPMTSAASEERGQRVVDEQRPVVLITDHQ